MRKANQSLAFPLFADGLNLSQAELLACQNNARAIPNIRHRARASMSGHRASQIKGRGMEFAEVRQYQQGDDVRTIDWRVTARTGKTHTKLFIEERERPILVLVDLKQSLYFGSQLLLQSVQAAHIAATLGWHAVTNGDRLGGLIVSETAHHEFKPRARNQGILTLINGLTDVHNAQLATMENPSPSPKELLAQACQRLIHLVKPGTLIHIITDGTGFNADCQQALSNIKRHSEICAFVVTDPLKNGTVALPKRFKLPVVDAGQNLILDRASYDDWLAKQQRQLTDFNAMMQQLNIPVKKFDAGLSLAQQLAILR